MDIKTFRDKIQTSSLLNIDGKNFNVREVVRFRLDDESFYIKCFLNDSYILADDSEREMFIFGKEITAPFNYPFPKTLDYEGKKFEFLYHAHAVAEEIWGKEIYKKGYIESFWDYQANDGSYLSLGYEDSSKKRLDLFGRVIEPDNVNIV